MIEFYNAKASHYALRTRKVESSVTIARNSNPERSPFSHLVLQNP